MNPLIIAVWLFAAALVALWLARTWSPRRARARTRATLITSGVDVVVVLALVRGIAPPPPAWSWLWLVAAALVGVGLAGAVRRWPALPWREPPRGRSAGRRAGDKRAIAGAAVYAAVGSVLLIALA
jgi:hypothetical protein